MGCYFFRFGRDKALLIQGGKFAQTILQLRPSLDSLTDRVRPVTEDGGRGAAMIPEFDEPLDPNRSEKVTFCGSGSTFLRAASPDGYRDNFSAASAVRAASLAS